ncbi:LOW QUALITY PROTEIN: hypothetical protein HID58_005437 [Brassica napus]|uniref:Uncharacterized protein n=1 Tax=Brassica napus TaxID=3708 RepID=A0ABQ8E8M6_BRANA|nr:LOW QUALITY PROTEIN: hypothetical protein HID58_005437 [Brassica napus]
MMRLQTFFIRNHFSSSSTLDDVISWLAVVVTCYAAGSKPILKLIFEGRNAHLHSSVLKPAHVLVKEVQFQIRCRLLGLDQEAASNRLTLATVDLPSHRHSPTTFLSLWFDMFQFFCNDVPDEKINNKRVFQNKNQIRKLGSADRRQRVRDKYIYTVSTLASFPSSATPSPRQAGPWGVYVSEQRFELVINLDLRLKSSGT